MLELEVEQLLLRLAPRLREQIVGSTPAEIAQLEDLAGRPLPPFYRWFLAHMGRCMGPLAYASIDFSLQKILACYRDGEIEPELPFLLIGYETNEHMPVHIYYFLDEPARDDAVVVSRFAGDDCCQKNYETFREMLAHSALCRLRIANSPQVCSGSFKTDGADVFTQLDSIMDQLGFQRPLSTGRFCGLYERGDAAMACRVTPRATPESLLFFQLGGQDSGTLRKILGEVATESAIEVKVETWKPLLP